MNNGEYLFHKGNGTSIDEQKVLAEADKVLGFDSNKNPIMVSVSSGSSGEVISVTQTNHGLFVNEGIRYDGTSFVKAQADTNDNADIIGVVSEVTDIDNFKYRKGGILPGSWIEGTHYYLSVITPGLISTKGTYNIGNVVQYVGTGVPGGLLIEMDVGYLITHIEGEYLTNISAESIGDLSNVDLTGIQNDYIIKYNSTSGNFEVSTDNDHDHNTIYYTETEISNFFSGSIAKSGYNKSNWDIAYGWGNHASVGYLTSFTETDPIFNVHTVSNIVNGTGFLKNNGTGTWSWDNNSYSLSSHNHSGIYEPIDATIIKQADVDDVAVNGAISVPISSNWAYDHANASNPHNITLSGLGFTGDTNANYFTYTHPDYSETDLNTTTSQVIDTMTIINGHVNGITTRNLTTGDIGAEPSFTKNGAFNKNFGTATNTVTEGNDSRLTDNRTPTDNSTTYAKIATDLKSSAAISAANIDWSSAGVFTKTLTAAITFTFSNLQLNKVITVVLTGDFTVTLPAYVKVVSGIYDGTVSNYIQFHCTNAGSTTEQVWCVISQEAV